MCTVAELRKAGREPKELAKLGITVRQLREGGYEASDMKDSNAYTLAELREGGATIGAWPSTREEARSTGPRLRPR